MYDRRDAMRTRVPRVKRAEPRPRYLMRGRGDQVDLSGWLGENRKEHIMAWGSFTLKNTIQIHTPLTLNVHIGHKAPCNGQEREQSSGTGTAAIVRGPGAGCHGYQVHGLHPTPTEQKAAVEKEGLPKAHIIPVGGTINNNAT